MASLALQRCAHHPDREAVARCPECTRFFCRECISEYEDRIICAGCLQRIAREAAEGPVRQRRFSLRGVWLAAQMGIGVLVAWYAFYTVGETLVSIPSDFHAEQLWQKLTGVNSSMDDSE